MKIKTTVLCLPVRSPGKTLAFYRDGLGFSEAWIEDGIIALELPNLSLFLMEKSAFETYSQRAGRAAQFPTDGAGAVISCAMESKEEIDSILQDAAKYGGSAPARPSMDETSGGYTGYFLDPDEHLWELVCPQP